MSWNPDTGKKLGPTMTGHKKWITAFAWEPYHLNNSCRRYSELTHDIASFLRRVCPHYHPPYVLLCADLQAPEKTVLFEFGTLC